MRLLEKSYKEKNDFMNKLPLIGSCQQVAMINLSVVKSHVNKPYFKTFRLFQILTEKKNIPLLTVPFTLVLYSEIRVF